MAFERKVAIEGHVYRVIGEDVPSTGQSITHGGEPIPDLVFDREFVIVRGDVGARESDLVDLPADWRTWPDSILEYRVRQSLLQQFAA